MCQLYRGRFKCQPCFYFLCCLRYSLCAGICPRGGILPGKHVTQEFYANQLFATMSGPSSWWESSYDCWRLLWLQQVFTMPILDMIEMQVSFRLWLLILLWKCSSSCVPMHVFFSTVIQYGHLAAQSIEWKLYHDRDCSFQWLDTGVICLPLVVNETCAVKWLLYVAAGQERIQQWLHHSLNLQKSLCRCNHLCRCCLALLVSLLRSLISIACSIFK